MVSPKIKEFAIFIEPVGSRITCDPPVMNTDEDFLILIKEKDYQSVIYQLGTDGYSLDNPSEHYRPENNQFNSWRCREENLIITSDFLFFRRFMAATAVAKKLNLLEKADRKMLFQAVLYGNGMEKEYSLPNSWFM